MLHAVRKNKLDRSSYKTNEDALTSSVFGRLAYLPVELLWNILETAVPDLAHNSIYQPITDFTFWPRFYKTEGTTNKNYVEPDVLIRFTHCNVLVEAKRRDWSNHNKEQWRNEIASYRKEFLEDRNKLIFIALGNDDSVTGEVDINISDNKREIEVYRCSWKNLLTTIKRYKDTIEDSSCDLISSNRAIWNVLSDLVLAFELFGFSADEWFDRFMPPIKISDNSINTLQKEIFTWNK